MKRLLIVAIIPLLALLPSSAQAISTPTTFGMDNFAECYLSVLESSDLLCVGQFEIQFVDGADSCTPTDQDACPTETVTEAFFGALVDTDGVTQLRSARPYTLQSQCCNGYGKGVFSIYADAADVTSLGITTTAMTTYLLQIQGDPLVFATAPSDTMNIQGQTSCTATGNCLLLRLDMLARAEDMEESWNLDLLDNINGINQFSATGETYFANAIPNLRSMEASLFQDTVTPVEFEEKGEDVSYDTSLRNYLQGGSTTQDYDTAITGLGTQLGMPVGVIKTFIGVMLALAVVMFVYNQTQHVGISLTMFPIALSILTLMSFGTLGFIALLAFLSAIGLIWVLVLKGA